MAEDVETEEFASLVHDVTLAALTQWLALPGSDVEKALKHAMRARHSELTQESRCKIAQGVLGIAVAYGRLQHCLQRLQRETDAPNLMELWKRQDELILFESTEVVSLSTRLATTWSVPQWMAENWLCQFGAMDAFQLGKAMAKPARVTLRVNTLKTTRLELMELLFQRHIRSIPTAESPVGLWLPDGRPPGGGVWQLPGL
eukprot:symbB.v1.2.028852.t1/scaffold3098.1/size63651/2